MSLEFYGEKIEYNNERLGKYGISPWGMPGFAYVDGVAFERMAKDIPINRFANFVSALNQEARSQLDGEGNVVEPHSSMQLFLPKGTDNPETEALENLLRFTDRIIEVLREE